MSGEKQDGKKCEKGTVKNLQQEGNECDNSENRGLQPEPSCRNKTILPHKLDSTVLGEHKFIYCHSTTLDKQFCT